MYTSTFSLAAGYLRFMLRVTELDIGATMLLFEAWHVRIAFRCSRLSLSNRNTFLTLLVPTVSKVSSKRAFSCHHVTRGCGRPGEIGQKKEEGSARGRCLCRFSSTRSTRPGFTGREKKFNKRRPRIFRFSSFSLGRRGRAFVT